MGYLLVSSVSLVGEPGLRVWLVFDFPFVGLASFESRGIKKLKQRRKSTALPTSVHRQVLFCVGEQVEPFEHLGIDLLSQFVVPLMP